MWICKGSVTFFVLGVKTNEKKNWNFYTCSVVGEGSESQNYALRDKKVQVNAVTNYNIENIFRKGTKKSCMWRRSGFLRRGLLKYSDLKYLIMEYVIILKSIDMSVILRDEFKFARNLTTEPLGSHQELAIKRWKKREKKRKNQDEFQVWVFSLEKFV